MNRPKCSQATCEKQATVGYDWPGHGQKYACDEHVLAVQNISRAMGLGLTLRTLVDHAAAEVVETSSTANRPHANETSLPPPRNPLAEAFDQQAGEMLAGEASADQFHAVLLANMRRSPALRTLAFRRLQKRGADKTEDGIDRFIFYLATYAFCSLTNELRRETISEAGGQH